MLEGIIEDITTVEFFNKFESYIQISLMQLFLMECGVRSLHNITIDANIADAACPATTGHLARTM